MSWKKILLILGVLGLVIILLFNLFFGSRDYSNAVNDAIIRYDLSGCQNLPSYKYTIESSPTILGGDSYDIVQQKKSCMDIVRHHFLVSDSDLPALFEAVKKNDPSLCPENDPNSMCLREIQKKYPEPQSCSYYFRESDNLFSSYSDVFKCQGNLMALQKQNVSYCEQFDKTLRDYCYYASALEYNRLRKFTPHLLVAHQTYEGEVFYFPKPAIPNICDKVEDSFLKSNCDNVFNDFEAWETPTLNS